MSDECTLDEADDEDERPWDEVIREASARFSAALNAMFGPPQCRKAEMTKLRRQAACDRYRARKKAARAETPEQAKERRSMMAAAREDRARAKRGGICRNGHEMTPENITAVGNGKVNCLACQRSRLARSNEQRRLTATLACREEDLDGLMDAFEDAPIWQRTQRQRGIDRTRAKARAA